jgi:hypothetical protein
MLARLQIHTHILYMMIGPYYSSSSVKYTVSLLLAISTVALSFAVHAQSSPERVPDRKGIIIVRHLAGVPITVDGAISDWPLDRFESIAEHPTFPQVQLASTSPALGDHIVFDPERIGLFNGTTSEAFKANASDFGSTIYFAYDDEFLHILAVCIDDHLRMERDTSDFGSTGFFNDGFEFFLDTRGNSGDCAAGLAFPNFDQEEPNVDDFQVTVALNENFKPSGVNETMLGVRQTVERGGDPDVVGPEKGGPGGSYRDALDAASGLDIAARRYDDLRAAGAINPEILAHPDVDYTGYVIEMRIPFGAVTAFTPDHPMGFELFWRDVDTADDPGKGGADVSWATWAQSTNVPCDDAPTSLFNAANWGTLVFDKDNGLGDGSASIGGNHPVSVAFDGDQVRIEYTGQLEYSGEVTGPWTALEGISPLSIVPSGARRFYRALSVSSDSTPIFSDDLESEISGWTHGAAAGKEDPWQWGKPRGGVAPIAAASGNHAWGTGLEGGYPNFSDAGLRTPVIDLTGIEAATLVFMEYLDVEALDDDGFVLDEVKVNILDASNPDGDPLAAAIRQRAGSVRGWLQRKIELPASALGSKIMVEFRFVSDSWNDFDQGGWFIDDVAVLLE